jgi:hypothetical protein
MIVGNRSNNVEQFSDLNCLWMSVLIAAGRTVSERKLMIRVTLIVVSSTLCRPESSYFILGSASRCAKR